MRPDLARLTAFGAVAFSVFARGGSRWRHVSLPQAKGSTRIRRPVRQPARLPFTLRAMSALGSETRSPSIRAPRSADPMTLYARVIGDAGHLERVEVGGDAVIVGRGEFVF